MWEQIQILLAENQLLTGGAILGSASLVISWLRPKLALLTWWLQNRIMVSLTVTDDMDQYRWLALWVARQPYLKKAKRLSFEELAQSQYNYDTDNQEAGASGLGLAPGWHLLWYGWHPIVVNRIRDKLDMAESGKSVRNEWFIRFFGTRAWVNELLNTLEAAYQDWQKECKGVSTYVSGDYHRFERCATVAPRSLDSVILPPTIKDAMVDDLRSFLDSKDWYRKMSIPWRRGYLLTGPPGCGKTSLVRAVSSAMKLDLYVISLSEVKPGRLADLFNGVKHGIILLEDVDCIFKDRESAQLGLSHLLNAIDGALSLEGRVLIMTTNHPELLDPALTRPGRVDLALKFEKPRKTEIVEMYRRFYPASKNGSMFAQAAMKYDPSMAELQGHLLKYRHCAGQAAKNLHEIEENRKARDAEVDALRGVDLTEDCE